MHHPATRQPTPNRPRRSGEPNPNLLAASIAALAILITPPLTPTTAASQPNDTEPSAQTSPTAAQRLIDAIDRNDTDTADPLADQLARRWISPDEQRRIITKLDTTAGDLAAPLIRALAGTGSRIAIEAVVNAIEPAGAARPVRSAGVNALSSMTGRTDLHTPRAWVRWWRHDASNHDEQRLANDIARWQAERVRLLQAERQTLASRLEAVFRRLYVAEPRERRSDLLVELMTADLPPLRALGYDLAQREVSSGRQPGQPVVDAAITGLEDPAPETRAAAARLLYAVNAEAVADNALRLLTTETEPEPAAELLRLLIRQPQPRAVPAILERLEAERPGPVLDAAIEAALAHQRAFGLDDEQRRRVLARVRQLADNGISATSVNLLAALGDADTVLKLLTSSRLPVAQAAARALDASNQNHLDAIVAAAQREPGLYAVATAALEQHRPTANGFIAAASLQAPAIAEREATLQRFAATLPPDQLLQAVMSEPDLATRATLLSAAVTPEFYRGLTDALNPQLHTDPNTDPTTPPDQPTPDTHTQPSPELARAKLAVLERLVDTQMALNRPSAALAAIEQAPPDVRAIPTFARDRITALVWLNRLDEAQRVAATLNTDAVNAWIEGIEGAASMPHARDAIQQLRAAFDDELNDDQRERLDIIEALLQQLENNQPQPDPTPDPTPDEATPANQPDNPPGDDNSTSN